VPFGRFDEIYGNDRHGAALSVVDALGGAVWQTAGPVGVDADSRVPSGCLLLWEAQARGLHWSVSIGDGGAALSQAAGIVAPDGEHRRDVWHVLHTCGQVHGRLARWVTALEAKTSTVARQAARLAAGRPLRGGRPGTAPQADPVAHAAQLARARAVVTDLEYLTGELRQLLEVVVRTPHGLLDAAARQHPQAGTRLDTLLALLAELSDATPAPQQTQLTQLHRQLVAALPALVSFAAPPGTHVVGVGPPAVGTAAGAGWPGLARLGLATPRHPGPLDRRPPGRTPCGLAPRRPHAAPRLGHHRARQQPD
jgi:hypothetical protein